MALLLFGLVIFRFYFHTWNKVIIMNVQSEITCETAYAYVIFDESMKFVYS